MPQMIELIKRETKIPYPNDLNFSMLTRMVKVDLISDNFFLFVVGHHRSFLNGVINHFLARI